MVKQEMLNLGIMPANGTKEIAWELTIDPSEIVHIVPDCGCTTNIHVDKDTKTLRATFVEDDAKGLTEEQKRDWYPEGKLPFSKSLTVYLRDEHNLVQLNAEQKTEFNPAKKNARIGFVGYVQFDLAEVVQ